MEGDSGRGAAVVNLSVAKIARHGFSGCFFMCIIRAKITIAVTCYYFYHNINLHTWHQGLAFFLELYLVESYYQKPVTMELIPQFLASCI